jgi:D-sedoheptulose 7-phosphate isomerase
MNNVERAYAASDGRLDRFAKGYVRYLTEVFEAMDWDEVEAFVDVLERARRARRTVFFAGNGGSAATASHFATDLGKGTRVPGRPGFRAVSLADNVAFMTALANDEGVDRMFGGQMRDLFVAGDVLVVISASGNSPNVVAAARLGKELGGTVVSLVGFDGGAVREVSDVTVHVRTEKGEYGQVEDIHLVLDHIVTLFLWLRSRTDAQGGESS